MPMLPEREIQIAKRLREFREWLRIPRTSFALSIGVGSERLASYEAARVPLRYHVFWEIHRGYFLNPEWLAEGIAPMAYTRPLTFLDAEAPGPTRLKFSQAYDRFITQWRAKLPNELATHYIALSHELIALIKHKPHLFTKDDLQEIQNAIDSGKLQIDRKGLTDVYECGNNPSVRSPMANLLERLNRATQERGMKSKLARFMGVPLANVSQWLSGEREPGGETTLRLLQWVQQQERSAK